MVASAWVQRTCGCGSTSVQTGVMEIGLRLDAPRSLGLGAVISGRATHFTRLATGPLSRTAVADVPFECAKMQKNGNDGRFNCHQRLHCCGVSGANCAPRAAASTDRVSPEQSDASRSRRGHAIITEGSAIAASTYPRRWQLLLVLFHPVTTIRPQGQPRDLPEIINPVKSKRGFCTGPT